MTNGANMDQDLDMVSKYHPHCVPLPMSEASIDSVSDIDNNVTINESKSTSCCVICAEKFLKNETDCRDFPLTCQHSRLFHNHCIQQWININTACPICRTEQPQELCSTQERIARKRQQEGNNQRARYLQNDPRTRYVRRDSYLTLQDAMALSRYELVWEDTQGRYYRPRPIDVRIMRLPSTTRAPNIRQTTSNDKVRRAQAQLCGFVVGLVIVIIVVIVVAHNTQLF